MLELDRVPTARGEQTEAASGKVLRSAPNVHDDLSAGVVPLVVVDPGVGNAQAVSDELEGPGNRLLGARVGGKRHAFAVLERLRLAVDADRGG